MLWFCTCNRKFKNAIPEACVTHSPGPGRVLCSDLVSEGGGDGGVALPGDGQGQEHRGGDGHVTHNIRGNKHQPGQLIKTFILNSSILTIFLFLFLFLDRLNKFFSF